MDTARRISAETKAKATATAVRDGLIERNPCMIERAMNPKAKRQALVPTIPELEAIADKLGSAPKRSLP